MADFAALRQRHSDHVLLSLLASTTARLLVSTMRTHHGAHERMGSLNKLLRALLASGDAAILAENIVKQMVRLSYVAQCGCAVCVRAVGGVVETGRRGNHILWTLSHVYLRM